MKTKTKRNNKSRKQLLPRDLKLLWGGAANRCSICRRKLVHDRTSFDPDVVVGIASHIIADSPDGPRGISDLLPENRHLYHNLILLCMEHSKVIDEQLQKYTISELKRIKSEHEAWVSERLSARDEMSEAWVSGSPIQKDIPVLDLESLARSGGQTQFIRFKITNMSQTQRAIDCQWEVRGFGYSFRDSDVNRFSLQPNFSKEVIYRLDTEKPYLHEVSELSLVMEYKDITGSTYFTRRELKQVRVPSGAFYEFQRGGMFYPAELITDIGIKSVSIPALNGDRYQCDFGVKVNGKVEIITIGISRTFLTTWGLEDDLDILKSIIAELGSRIICKMLLKKEPMDYLFITDNFPQEYQNGIKGYQLLRDSL